MGKDFLSGYCQLVTGEKDPRNLRLAFSIERVMLVEFDISESVEVCQPETSSFSSKGAESAYFIGSVRCHILLLPHNVHSAT